MCPDLACSFLSLPLSSLCVKILSVQINLNSGRGAEVAHRACNTETAVQFRSPDPICQAAKEMAPIVLSIGARLSCGNLLLAVWLFPFRRLRNWRRQLAFGINRQIKGYIQEHLTSLPYTPGRARRVWLRLLSVQRSSRSSLGRGGSRNCFVRLLNPLRAGLCVVVTGVLFEAGVVDCSAAPATNWDMLLPTVSNVQFAHVIASPSFGWWLGMQSFNTAIVIGLFWIFWVFSGDQRKG